MRIHKITTDFFSANPDIWGRELSEKIELEILLMNLHLKGIDNKDFDLEGSQDFSGIPRLHNLNPTKRKDLLISATITNAFLSIFRGLVSFLDKTLALSLASLESQKNPIGPVQDINEFLESFPTEEYLKISSNQNLNFPEKLKILTSLHERTKERLIGYNKIRVAFEHYSGIAKNEIQFPISTFERESQETGYQKVTFRLDKPETKYFNKKELISLKAQDVSLIGIDIKAWVIKDLLAAILNLK